MTKMQNEMYIINVNEKFYWATLSRFQSQEVFLGNTFAVYRPGVLYGYSDNYCNYRGAHLLWKNLCSWFSSKLCKLQKFSAVKVSMLMVYKQIEPMRLINKLIFKTCFTNVPLF